MSLTTTITALTELGPGSTRTWSPAESRQYCRQLARTHYENFTVASWLLPRDLRQHFYNVYAYCRWADDLADETGDGRKSLELLDWWHSELEDCYQGRATHPVFVALAETIDTFEIPAEPFIDLLIAFRQDQTQTRYASRRELLEYCRYSANPVGRLVLYLGRCVSPATLRLSDSICTGLQLANFWQDVARDWDRGRRYLPKETMETFGLTESAFARRIATEPFRAALKYEVEQARQMLVAGLPLVDLVPDALALDVWLFVQGGLSILNRIEQQQYDVWLRRPVVSKREQLRLFVKGWWQLRGRRPQGGDRS
jgi:squalene synthase HpnC